MKIEALHDFHDADFSQGWADRFVPTPERLRLFQTILQHIEDLETEALSVLELGIGPGYLAGFLLKNLPNITYEGLDFSEAMLEIANKKTAQYSKRIHFTQADLVRDNWTAKLKKAPTVIVSTWALHDLLEKKNIASVYQSAYEALPKGGILLNGDFIKPETSTYEYEGGRIKPSEHIELLQVAGFQYCASVAEFEVSVEQPTTANNYVCFKAIK